MLLGNYSILNRNCDRLTGSPFTNPMGVFKATSFHAFYLGGHVVTGETNKSSFNNGYNTTELGGFAWWLSPNAGGIGASRFSATGSVTASAAGGLNGIAALSGSGDISTANANLIALALASLSGSGIVSSASIGGAIEAVAALSGFGSVVANLNALGALLAALSGSGDITASGQIVVAAIASLTGSGNISAEDLRGIVAAIAVLSGSGDITALLAATLPAFANLSGSGDVSTASLLALGELISALSGVSSVTTTLTAKGELITNITSAGDVLSTSNVAEAVWGALSEGTFTYAQCLQIIAAACAAKTSNTGQTFRDLSNTKDRIVGTVVGGERTAVTYDLD